MAPASRRNARRTLPLAIAVCVAAAVLAPAASAACEDIQWRLKWSPDISGETGGSLIRVPYCIPAQGSRPHAKPQRRKARHGKRRKTPTRAQYRALRFHRSKAVSAKVRRRLVDWLAYGSEAAQIKALIESGNLLRQFNADLRRSGWSTRDLGDAYAKAYVIMWLVVHGRHRVGEAVDRAVRADVRRQLALDRSVRRAGDRSQQETAEWLGSWTTVIAGTWNTLRRRGDVAGARAWRKRARRMIMDDGMLGVDLAAVRLTRRGIQRR